MIMCYCDYDCYSKVWEYYLEVCNDNNSFFGMTWPHLRSLLNNVEMTKTYNLNPLAPEFIPKSIYPGQQGQPVFMAAQQHQPSWVGPNPYRGLQQPVSCESTKYVILLNCI